MNIIKFIFALYIICISIACSNTSETDLYMMKEQQSQQNLNGQGQAYTDQTYIRNSRLGNMVEKKENCCCCFRNVGDFLFCWFACPCWCFVRACCDTEGAFYK